MDEMRLFGYWFEKENRFVSLEESERLFDAEEADLLLVSLYAKRCEYCDDTGDVHNQIGEWRGTCTCPAGIASKSQS